MNMWSRGILKNFVDVICEGSLAELFAIFRRPLLIGWETIFCWIQIRFLRCTFIERHSLTFFAVAPAFFHSLGTVMGPYLNDVRTGMGVAKKWT